MPHVHTYIRRINSTEKWTIYIRRRRINEQQLTRESRWAARFVYAERGNDWRDKTVNRTTITKQFNKKLCEQDNQGVRRQDKHIIWSTSLRRVGLINQSQATGILCARQKNYNKMMVCIHSMYVCIWHIDNTIYMPVKLRNWIVRRGRGITQHNTSPRPETLKGRVKS